MKKEPKAKQPKIKKEPKAKQPTDSSYHLAVKFNNLTFEFDTNDLFASFRQIPTPLLKSKVVVAVTDTDGKKGERSLLGPMARSLFRNDTALRILFKRLLLK